MAVELVYETHAITTDNETGIATGNRWALDILVLGRALDDLVDVPFQWQPGWHYRVSSSGLGVRRYGRGE